jgi:hypothetical protein
MRRTVLHLETSGGARRRLFVVVAAAALVAAPALAESPYCSDLKAQIARADAGGSPRYRAAAVKQQAELARAVGYARSVGCERQQFLFFGDAPPPQCGQLAARIEQMRANLGALQARSGGDEGRKQALMARYDEQCRQHQPERNLFEQLFGGGPAPAPVISDEPVAPPAQERVREWEPQDETTEEGRPRGGSEAVCVRHCDGGFFPITYSAKPSNLDDLNALCKALCPNAEAELYTKGPWRDIDSAVSINGDPYSDLPNALKFQKTRDPSCSCKPKDQSWSDALADAERILETSYARDVPVTAEQAEQMSRPLPAGGASASPRAGKKQSSRRDPNAVETPPIAVAPNMEKQAPKSLGQAEGEVRVTVGADGVSRRVRVVAPAL